MPKLRLRAQKGARPGSNCARCTSAILKLKSNYPCGMTLIELLVVIVILTTLVVSVVPILSPNNDSRKIREASRGLHAYITLAQAKAARSGRPVGIAFRESAPGSGVALEVFQLQVPKGFPGFSEESTAIFRADTSTTEPYDFILQLGEGMGSSFDGITGPYVPNKLARPSDILDLDGIQFRLESSPAGESNGFFNEASRYTGILINSSRDSMTFNSTLEFPIGSGTFWTNPKPYKILRQPANSSESPYQLPAGVAIDMQGSVVEGGVTDGFPAPNSLATTASDASDTVGIMFSPAGGVSDVFFNGSTITNVAKLILLLGRVENGGLQTTSEYTLTGLTNDQLEERQEKINWLNLDSRWLAIAARSGRVVVSENAFVTETKITTDGGDPDSSEDQIEAAHEFVHAMKQGGGR